MLSDVPKRKRWIHNFLGIYSCKYVHESVRRHFGWHIYNEMEYAAILTNGDHMKICELHSPWAM